MKNILIAILLLSFILLTECLASGALAAELFVKPSGTGTTCTQANPCSLETALAQAADDDAIYVAGGTYTGTGDAVVTLTKSVALYGSWKGNASGTLVRDSNAYPSTLDGETGYGGGIYVRGSNGTIITGNTISDNSGSLIDSGAGGGVCIVLSGARTQIMRNQVLKNVATSTAEVAWGGGIHLAESDAIVQDNLIQGNVASTEGSSQGSGIFQFHGAPTIRGNLVTENKRGEAVYLGYSEAQFEANLVLKNDTDTGVYLLNGEGAGPTLTNNIIAENEINNFTATSNSEYPITASFINNTLVGKGNNSDTSGVYVGTYSTVIMKNTIIGIIKSEKRMDG